MSLYNLPNATSGLDTIAKDTITAVPSFIPMLLFFIYLVITVGGSLSQKTRTGIADLPVWSTIGAVSTLMVALALSLSPGLMSLPILGIVATVTILSGLWLFNNQGSREV